MSSNVISAVRVFILLFIVCWVGNSKAQVHGLIEAAVSENYFSIEPGFNGTSIILFGSVDQDKIPGDLPDIAITINGPEYPLTIWQKERYSAIWMNTKGFTFLDVPTFFATLTSRPLEDIASKDELLRYEIGLDAIRISGHAADNRNETVPPKGFREALVRLKRANGTFIQNNDSIEWLGKRLFRARVKLPAAAGPGLYRSRILILHNRKVVGETAAQVTLQKVGIEQFLSSVSENQPWIYGIGAVFIATFIGFSASLVLKRN